MIDSHLLFSENNVLHFDNIKLRRKNAKLVYQYISRAIGEIDMKEIRNIISFVNGLKRKYKNLSIIPIQIDLGTRKFADKFTYICLEALVYALITVEKASVEVLFNCNHTIFNEGIKASCLLTKAMTAKSKNEYVSKFAQNISLYHYRKILLPDGPLEQTCILMQDIDNFLNHLGIEEGFSNDVATVISELADNALDHVKSGCLIDIDVTGTYEKADSEKEFVGINIVVMNCSKVILGDLIRDKLDDMCESDQMDRYQQVLRAREYHSKFWDSYYTEEDFYVITSFQHKISSRRAIPTGGTGLTNLIKNIQDKSSAYHCYCLSGSRVIKLKKEMIAYNDDDWVGFNNAQNYLSDIPDPQCVNRAPFFFAGTAYNLNFVYERKGANHEQPNN